MIEEGATQEMVSGGGRLRAWLLSFAVAAMVFGVLHHTDHVIRGNRSGWPFQGEVTPFTFPEETPPEEWRDLRESWDRLHAMRVVLNAAGLGLLLLGTIREEYRR